MITSALEIAVYHLRVVGLLHTRAVCLGLRSRGRWVSVFGWYLPGVAAAGGNDFRFASLQFFFFVF